MSNFACTIIGHKTTFVPLGRVLRCSCGRCGLIFTERVYDNAEQARSLARNLNPRDRRRRSAAPRA